MVIYNRSIYLLSNTSSRLLTFAFIEFLVAIAISLNLQKYAHKVIEHRALQLVDKTIKEKLISSNDNSKSNSIQDLTNNSETILGDNAVEQDSSLLHDQDHSQQLQMHYYKEPIWWFGIVLMVVGEFGNFLAYGFSPAVYVAPLGCTAIIVNAILAPIFLHENIIRRHLIGIFLASFGTVAVTVSSKIEHDSPSPPYTTPEELAKKFLELKFVIYLIVTVTCGTWLSYLSYMKRGIAKKMILVDLGLVAIYGGYTVITTKALSSFLKLKFLEVFAYPITYPIALILIITSVLQVVHLNRSLSYFPSIKVVPIQFTLFTLSAMVGSAITFDDFAGMPASQLVVVLVSVLFVFAGVWLITRQSASPTAGGYQPLSMLEDDIVVVGVGVSSEEEDGEIEEKVHMNWDIASVRPIANADEVNSSPLLPPKPPSLPNNKVKNWPPLSSSPAIHSRVSPMFKNVSSPTILSTSPPSSTSVSSTGTSRTATPNRNPPRHPHAEAFYTPRTSPSRNMGAFPPRPFSRSFIHPPSSTSHTRSSSGQPPTSDQGFANSFSNILADSIGTHYSKMLAFSSIMDSYHHSNVSSPNLNATDPSFPAPPNIVLGGEDEGRVSEGELDLEQHNQRQSDDKHHVETHILGSSPSKQS